MKIPFPVRALPSLAFRAWLTPPPIGAGTIEMDREAVSDLDHVYFGGVPGLEAGTGPLALVVHGWGGRVAQMAPMARRLAADGLKVIVPELPGHAGGGQTDIKRAAAVLSAVVDDVGRPELIVGHSFASMVLRLAFPETAPRRVVMVAPALDVRDALAVFGNRLRLLPWARRGLRDRLEAWDRSLWPLMATVSPGQLPGAEVLIVHDPEDQETPFSRSAELAAIRPGTSIVAVPGLGHRRILSDGAALDLITEFVSGHEIAGDNAA